MSEREEKFERMMQAVLNSYNSTAEKMDKKKSVKRKSLRKILKRVLTSRRNRSGIRMEIDGLSVSTVEKSLWNLSFLHMVA